MQFTHRWPSYLDGKDRDHKKILAALQHHPEDAVLLHGLILQATFFNDHDQCIQSADFLIANAKDNMHLFWAYYHKATILEQRNENRAALELLKKAAEHDDDKGVDILPALAGVYTKLN